MAARAPRILPYILPKQTRQRALPWKYVVHTPARSTYSSATCVDAVDQPHPFRKLVRRQISKQRDIFALNPGTASITIRNSAQLEQHLCPPFDRDAKNNIAHKSNRHFLFSKKPSLQCKTDSHNTTTLRMVCTSACLRSQQLSQDKAEAEAIEQPQEQLLTTEEAVAAANAKFLAFIEGLPSLQRPEHLKTIVASSAESINKNIIAMTSEGETIYGLDIEWQPQFQKGAKENKTALIQICNSKTVLLMQVHRLKYLPTALTQFLRERRFLKSGVNIRGDGLKLARDFGVECNGFIDLGTVCKHIYPHETRMSLRALTGSYLGYKMDKKKKVILSNWSSFRLSQAQIKYASLDAYASYKLSAVFCEALKKLGTGSEHFVMASIAIEKDAAKESDKNHRGVSMKPNTPSPQGTHNNTRSAHHYHPKSTTTIIKRTDSQAEKASV